MSNLAESISLLRESSALYAASGSANRFSRLGKTV